jgi:hypothetical protein
LQLACEVLIEDLLNEGVTGLVEVLQEFLHQVQSQQID